MSINLSSLDNYTTIQINNIDLYNSFKSSNYTYANVEANYADYASSFTISKLQTSINDSSINYDLIEEILSNIIGSNITFNNLFNSSETTPYYIYDNSFNQKDFLIKIIIDSVDTYFLISFIHEEESTENATDEQTENTTEETTSSQDQTTTNSLNNVASFANNEILFAKSLDSSSNIFERISKN